MDGGDDGGDGDRNDEERQVRDRMGRWKQRVRQSIERRARAAGAAARDVGDGRIVPAPVGGWGRWRPRVVVGEVADAMRAYVRAAGRVPDV